MKIAVLGAGNAGQITAFDLTAKGAEVRLYTRDPEKAARITENGMRAEGKLTGAARPALATTDMRAAVSGADLILVQTTAAGHRPMAEAAKPHLAEGQIIIVFNANWGALEFSQVLGPAAPVIIGEVGTQLYLGAAPEPGKVFSKQIKESAPLALTDNARLGGVIERLKPYFPQFRPAAGIIETSLSSANAIVHTPVCLFNMARIDLGHDFFFYAEGASRATIDYVAKIDGERVAVMEALGVPARSMLDILNSFWPDQKDTLYAAITENPSYKQVKAPKTLDHRFITEDLPFGIVPQIHLGRELGVPTPCMEAMLESFSRFLDRDFMADGFKPDPKELLALK